ncbi:MAG TPA: DUF429 domain-containing protein [Polyangia bacterium]|nr:DUF429 domain-containing protein [Polyangia bacterium]
MDLGGGKGKKTALATLRVDATNATVVEIAPRGGERPFYDTTLVETIRQFGDDTLLCLDAPLTLPPCLRCEVPVCPGQDNCVDPSVVAMRAIFSDAAAADPELVGGRGARRGKPSLTPYTQRTTEVYLAHRLRLAPREALGQGTGPLAARAAHVLRALADRFHLNENLLEVYPKGTLAALGFTRPYKKHLHERETRARILDALSGDLRFGPGVWRELCVQSDHLFEAVICAYTGYLWARDAWTAPAPFDARVGEGWIWTPPVAAVEEEGAVPASAEG